MKKIGWKAYSIFILAFIITLLVTAPASLLAKIVESSSKGQFILANVTGTVWRGSAVPAIHQRSGKLLALETLHWDVAVLPLFAGKIVLQLNWDNVGQAQPMVATIMFNKIELRNAIVPLPASILGELTPMLQPVQLSGQMQIRSEQISFSPQGINGIAIADWLNAGSILSAVSPLGNYRINMTGAGERLEVSLMTLSGALLLEGKGSLSLGQGLKFQVTARAAENNKGGLDELLNNFGPESSPGVHTVNIMR